MSSEAKTQGGKLLSPEGKGGGKGSIRASDFGSDLKKWVKRARPKGKGHEEWRGIQNGKGSSEEDQEELGIARSRTDTGHRFAVELSNKTD